MSPIGNAAAIIGTSSWGTTLGIMLAGKGLGVTLWARTEEEAETLNRERLNSRHLPGFALPGPIDPVGAGDAVTAAAAAALAAGASAAEAGLLGVLAASVTVEKIGECGTASPDEVRARFAEYARAHPTVAGEGAER